ncbi:MAG: mucoidy inhibitor MuiA family protein, partial [Candidatus Heimdallarchaeota archaeon]|nr:mucoidy inhibitor MuiA family protein [Candidatus Heimdallarchaeota archaeon]
FGEWGLRKGLTADDFNKYFEYYQTGARAEKTKQVKLENEIEDLQEELKVIRAKKNQLSHSDSQFYEVDITLDIQDAGSIELEVGYSISQARWEPQYIVDLLKETATIQRLAKVYNHSGFDWKNVNIIVTTGTRKPVSIDSVAPFYLRLAPLYQPPRKRMAMVGGAGRMKSAKKMDMDAMYEEKEEAMPLSAPAPAAEAPPMTYQESEISISQTGHQRFELSGKHNIPSGSIPKTLHLDHFELNLEKSYYWSSTQPNLIMTHELENDQYFLLPGNAKVFIAGEYISQSYLDTIHPKEKFTLGIVESYDLKVDKKLIHRDVQKKGLIKGKRLMEFGYEIKIQNQVEIECKLKLIDRLPHALDENIEVEIDNLNIEPKEKNQGVYEWEFNLKKDDEIKITYDYDVRYPPERKLTPPL